MTIIQNQVSIDKPVAEVYAFLADCNNHEQLMPSSVYSWSSTQDEAQFTIQNMAKLALKVDSRQEKSEVVLVPSEKAPFDVSVRWSVKPQGDNSTVAKLVIEADLPVMMKMLAASPLQKLVDEQVTNLRKALQKAAIK
ncbi:SRPBCC family protein [Parapedobacter sp. ISTM3]|uniref:Polyketide cyclase / dehydrase and lipid transport n=1 Tax=Parapedobacter luteus TaxID=623280 RepID=A0A1T5AXQ2_9SPHI|nr:MULTISPECIES: SRPBCC family protein [Parapedobacter]MBK1440332.1 SRPBCC family protein [Parapedobacter sp. ISTM3]SKB39599.1 Polyketide cyclase / dehydrase and lipid transport [Parapedobacter luteus]